jgi:biotin carboxyl carrier protein
MTARRYTLAIDGQAFTIDVAETAADAFEVSVDGRRFRATLAGDFDAPAVSIAESMSPSREPAGLDAPAPVVVAEPPPAGIPVAPTARPSRSVPRPSTTGLLNAPMPGAILEVRVAPGAVVRRGDDLLVLEAMKMRNVIRAPRDATVAEVLVEAGAQVASGDPLVRFAPTPA